jgi:hypothetical protein
MQCAIGHWFPGYSSEQLAIEVDSNLTYRLMEIVPVTNKNILQFLKADAVYKIGIADQQLGHNWNGMTISNGVPHFVDNDKSTVALLSKRLSNIDEVTPTDLITMVESFAVLRGYSFFYKSPLRTEEFSLKQQLTISRTDDQWSVKCTLFSTEYLTQYLYSFTIDEHDILFTKKVVKIIGFRH